MTMTDEMREMMERTMAQYLDAYWAKHATPEQKAKAEAEGKSGEDAYQYIRSVVQAFKRNGGDCVAMPDELAYYILMEYMEHEVKGAKYKTQEELEREVKAKEAEAKRKEAEAEAKRKALETRAAEMSADSLLSVTAEDLAKAEADAKAAKEAAKLAKAKRVEAVKVERKVAEQMSLFG